jgi:hypothetical protein
LPSPNQNVFWPYIRAKCASKEEPGLRHSPVCPNPAYLNLALGALSETYARQFEDWKYKGQLSARKPSRNPVPRQAGDNGNWQHSAAHLLRAEPNAVTCGAKGAGRDLSRENLPSGLNWGFSPRIDPLCPWGGQMQQFFFKR